MRFNRNQLPDEGETVFKIDPRVNPHQVIRSKFTHGTRFLFWPDMFTTPEDLDNCPVFSNQEEAEEFLMKSN